MDNVCCLTDGKRISDKTLLNLDVKYLRGERAAKELNSGKLASSGALMILVDGENSGEIFRAPHDGYQGSTFKQLSISDGILEDYLLLVIRSHRKALRENKVGSAIPHLNKKLFREIEVFVPPVKEQQRIVDAFNYVEDEILIMMESL